MGSIGGYDLSVKLTQGSKSCETGKIEDFSTRDFLKWNSHNNNMGDCSSTEFDLNELFLNFTLITSYYNNYCPGSFQVNFERGIYNYYDFDVYPKIGTFARYNQQTNERVHSAKRRGKYFYSTLATGIEVGQPP